MMFRHILIATDGSIVADRAAHQGLELARQLGAEVTAVTVTEGWIEHAGWLEVIGTMTPPWWAQVYAQAAQQNAASILDTVKDMAEAKQVPCTTLYVPDQHPAEGIVDTVKARGCDAIVMGSHGRRGMTKLLMGSVAAKVVALSEVPVLVCP
jgi:nucleotide-binding universal stress UspA family protein